MKILGRSFHQGWTMSNRFLSLMLALPLLFTPLHAGVLAGDSIDVTHYFPNLSAVDLNMGIQTAPASFDYRGVYDLTVNDTTILFDAHCDCGWADAVFNGPVITDLSRSPITNVTIDGSSSYAGFDGSRLSFDGSHVYINVQGLDANGFLQFDLNGSGSVPEPGTLGLLGVALFGVAFGARRRSFR